MELSIDINKRQILINDKELVDVFHEFNNKLKDLNSSNNIFPETINHVIFIDTKIEEEINKIYNTNVYNTVDVQRILELLHSLEFVLYIPSIDSLENSLDKEEHFDAYMMAEVQHSYLLRQNKHLIVFDTKNITFDQVKNAIYTTSLQRTANNDWKFENVDPGVNEYIDYFKYRESIDELKSIPTFKNVTVHQIIKQLSLANLMTFDNPEQIAKVIMNKLHIENSNMGEMPLLVELVKFLRKDYIKDFV